MDIYRLCLTLEFQFDFILISSMPVTISVSKSVLDILSVIRDMNPGLPKDAKVLCHIRKCSSEQGEEDENTTYEIMFIRPAAKKDSFVGVTKKIRGTKKNIRRLFDYSLC